MLNQIRRECSETSTKQPNFSQTLAFW